MSSRYNPNLHYGYPECFEEAFARNVTTFEELNPRANSASSSYSPSRLPAGPNRPWAAQWHGGPQTPAPFPAVPPNPPRLYNPIQYHPAPAPSYHPAVAPQGQAQNMPPPPPFASGAVSAFSGGPSSFNQAQSTAFNNNAHAGIVQARRGRLAPGGFGNSSINQHAPQHGYQQKSSNTRVLPHRPAPTTAPSSSSRPAPAATAAPAPAASGRRPRQDNRVVDPNNIVLDEGFQWDKRALALLGLHKIKRKKGWAVIAASGAFPDFDAAELAEVWATKQAQVKAAYAEIYT